MTRSHDDPPRLGRLEILGAWLHVWTPHRDAEAPPVPWRSLAIGAVVLVVGLGTAAAIVVPRVQEGKRAGASLAARDAAKRKAAEQARVRSDQVAHRGEGPRTRAALYGRAQAAVLADARARAGAGTIQGPIRDLTCAPAPGTTGDAFDCTAVTDRIAATAQHSGGALGYPFRLKLDVRRGTFAWCKQNPVAGEQAVPDPRDVVALPRACRV